MELREYQAPPRLVVQLAAAGRTTRRFPHLQRALAFTEAGLEIAVAGQRAAMIFEIEFALPARQLFAHVD